MSQSVLSYRREGFRAQLQHLDDHWAYLHWLFDNLLEFIRSDRFLSPKLDDYSEFMEKASTFIASLTVTGTTLQIQPPTLQQPSQDVQREQWFKYAILGVGLFLLFAGALQRMISGEVMFFGIIVVTLSLALPNVLSELAKHLPAHLEEAKADSFEAYVQEKLGDLRVTKKRIGMMRLYRGALRLCERLEGYRIPEEVTSRLIGKPILAEGLRGRFKMKYRTEFPARLSEILNLVDRAILERRTLLNNAMREVAGTSPRAALPLPQQPQGGAPAGGI